jgi:hypothetical protein
VLYAASLLLILSLAARLITSWKTYGDLDTPSGVWATMAVDLVDGNTLYRPIISPLGYVGSLIFISIFFALAVSAKITSIFGITSVLAWLAFRDQWRDAIPRGRHARASSGLV